MFDVLIQEAGARYGVPVSWIKAVITVESDWNPNAFNPADPSYGLMQILDTTARAYGITNLNSLFDPAINIDVGTNLLGDLIAVYGYDFRRVYSAYNSGDPDLWEVSAQVAENVRKALDALAGWSGGSGGGGLLLLAGMFLFVRKNAYHGKAGRRI